MKFVLDIIEPVEDISLWALDETGKRLESNNYYSWSPIGEPTVIEHNGCHKGLNIIGATEVLKHFNFVYDAYIKGECTVTAAHIIKFLERLMLYDRARGVNITVVQWDNASIHKAYEVKQFARNHESDLILIHQPPYSPELNPQENMWNWMKKFLAQAAAYKNEQELLAGIMKFEAYIASRPDDVKQWLYARNFFK